MSFQRHRDNDFYTTTFLSGYYRKMYLSGHAVSIIWINISECSRDTNPDLGLKPFFRSISHGNELRVVCDSILFAKQLPSDVVRTILRKLVPAASPRRESYLMNVEYLADMNRNENRYLYETLRKIDSAIRNNRHLAITSCGYNIDGKLEEQGE